MVTRYGDQRLMVYWKINERDVWRWCGGTQAAIHSNERKLLLRDNIRWKIYWEAVGNYYLHNRQFAAVAFSFKMSQWNREKGIRSGGSKVNIILIFK